MRMLKVDSFASVVESLKVHCLPGFEIYCLFFYLSLTLSLIQCHFRPWIILNKIRFGEWEAVEIQNILRVRNFYGVCISYIIQISNTGIYPSLFSTFLLMRYIEIRFCICQFMPHIHSLIWNLTLIFSAFPVGVAQPYDFLSTDLIRWGISFGPLGTVNGVISLNNEIFSKTKDTVRSFPLLL